MPLRAGDTAFLPQLARYRAAGVDVVSLNIGFGPQSLEEHIRVLAWFRDWLKQRPDDYILVATPDDAERAAREGKLGICFDIEGMAVLDAGDCGLVQLFADLGVRWMLIAYNRNNRVGGGCQDDDGGLTAYGREVLSACARAGIAVCCSHAGERTALEVIEQAGGPVIFSHSNARALYDHPRNITDRVIDACAARGGVIGVNGLNIFLDGASAVTAGDVVRHIDYIVQRVGPAHAGLGLDTMFDMAEVDDYFTKMRSTFPDGLGYDRKIEMVPPEAVPKIRDGLARLGYAEADRAAILGGNWLRIAKAVWR